MTAAYATSLGVVAYLALFIAVGILFLFANLLVGWFLRPSDLHDEKREIYECGEPTIGSSFVQFDLRFYVVALVFLVFDVEVAFLFPWATVFGKATILMSSGMELVQQTAGGGLVLTEQARHLYQELGVHNPVAPSGMDPVAAAGELRTGIARLAWFSAAAVGVFFTVLLVGFAYEWKTGAFDWVRAVTRERAAEIGGRKSGRPGVPPQEPVVSV